MPGFDTSKARIVQHYATATNTNANTNNTVSFQVSPADESPEKLISPDPSIGPTAAELILPWRRDRSYQSIGKCCILVKIFFFFLNRTSSAFNDDTHKHMYTQHIYIYKYIKHCISLSIIASINSHQLIIQKKKNEKKKTKHSVWRVRRGMKCNCGIHVNYMTLRRIYQKHIFSIRWLGATTAYSKEKC